MSARRSDNLADVFQPVLPLMGMLNAVPTRTLMECVVDGEESLAAVDPASLGIHDRRRLPADELHDLVDGILETARAGSLVRSVPGSCDGVPSADLIGSILLYTMETPFPFYRLVTTPLNVSGPRDPLALRAQMPYLKLLVCALRFLRAHAPGEYVFTGTVYRGVDVTTSTTMKAKYDNYATSFPAGGRITFAAPTSVTLEETVAKTFTKGIQFVITGARGMRLRCGELSMYPEEEVLMEPPVVCEVTAVTKPDQTVIVFMKAIPSTMLYLKNETGRQRK